MPAHSRGNMLSIELKLPNKRIIDINLPEKSKVTDIYAIAEEATGIAFPAKDCSLFWKGSRMGHNMTLDYYRITNRGKIELVRKMKTGYDAESTATSGGGGKTRIHYPLNGRRPMHGAAEQELIPDDIVIPNTPSGALAAAEGRVGSAPGPYPLGLGGDGVVGAYGLGGGNLYINDGFNPDGLGMGMGAARRDDRIDIPATLHNDYNNNHYDPLYPNSNGNGYGGARRPLSGGDGGSYYSVLDATQRPYSSYYDANAINGGAPPTPAYYGHVVGNAGVNANIPGGNNLRLYQPTYPGLSQNGLLYDDPIINTVHNSSLPLPSRFANSAAAASLVNNFNDRNQPPYSSYASGSVEINVRDGGDISNTIKAISPKRSRSGGGGIGEAVVAAATPARSNFGLPVSSPRLCPPYGVDMGSYYAGQHAAPFRPSALPLTSENYYNGTEGLLNNNSNYSYHNRANGIGVGSSRLLQQQQQQPPLSASAAASLRAAIAANPLTDPSAPNYYNEALFNTSNQNNNMSSLNVRLPPPRPTALGSATAAAAAPSSSSVNTSTNNGNSAHLIPKSQYNNALDRISELESTVHRLQTIAQRAVGASQGFSVGLGVGGGALDVGGAGAGASQIVGGPSSFASPVGGLPTAYQPNRAPWASAPAPL